MFFLRPDYSSRSPSCSRLWRRQNSWRTSKLMNPLIFLVKTITPTLNMSPHTPFKNVYDDWRHTVLRKGSAFLVQQNAKAQTNFSGWESIFIIYKVVYMYAIVHCTKHHHIRIRSNLWAGSATYMLQCMNEYGILWKFWWWDLWTLLLIDIE